ncbi:MAG TPA: sulfotransferase, partial [Gemmatimonadaceae bacterium]|nr:sulfotransferase [Gemmatimonadaceae bacterium]
MERPPFVFVVGAAGSGTTFMFRCLTQDPDTYGINEDALGPLLAQLQRSEEEFGRCPHSTAAFRDFLHALRADRPTLVLKTPSNLRCVDALRRVLPGARFVCLVREPHSAVASGLERHRQPVADVAALWQRDMERAHEASGAGGADHP